MEQVLNITVNRNKADAEVLIEVNCTGEELIKAMSHVLLQLNDYNQAHFRVKNGWWLLVNARIAEELKQRSEKR